MENGNSSYSQNGSSPNKRTDSRSLKSERKKKKMKILKDENQHLKDLLKQISHSVSNSGLLNNAQQEALAEAIALEDNEMLDADLSMETVDTQGGIDFAVSSGSKFEPPDSRTSRNPTQNNGFQFGHHKSSAVVMPSVKQTTGSNFFLNSLGEVVKDLDSADELDVTSFDLKALREQICFRSVDFAPISPLPPTPPPKAMENTPEDSQKLPTEESLPSVLHQSERSATPKKKHSFNHQQSTGFDVPGDQNTIRLNSTSVACSASLPASSISDTGFGKYEFVSKRSSDGGVMLTFSLKDDISLNVDSNTWQITCHIPDPKRKQPECTPNQFGAPPGNHSFSSGRRNREEGCVPFKRQKLSYSEEVPEMVLPSMHGIDIGNFGKKNNHESRFHAPSKLSEPSLNNSTFLLKEDSSFDQVMPNYSQDTKDVFRTQSVATAPCNSSLTETLSKSSEDINLSLKSNAKKTEKVVSCLDDTNILLQSNTNEEISLLSVAVSSDVDVSNERNSLPNYSFKKQRKRSVTNIKEVSSDHPFENSNKSLSTDVKALKQTTKKQKIAPSIFTDASISKSVNVKAQKNQQGNKSSKKLLNKVQKVESEDSMFTGYSQEVEDEASKIESMLEDFERELFSTQQCSLEENINSSLNTEGTKLVLSEKEDTSTNLDSQEVNKRNNSLLEKSKNLTPEINDESMILQKKLEQEEATSEPSTLEKKPSNKSEEINQSAFENEVESKSFLRTLGLISSSELCSQEEQIFSYSSCNKNGELDSSLEGSSSDVKKSTPRQESSSDKLGPSSSNDEVSCDEKKKASPENLTCIAGSEHVLENSKQCQLNNEKESSVESMEHSSPKNKANNESSVNRMRRRSSSKEDNRVLLIEPLPQKRTYRRRMVKENPQNASQSQVPVNMKKTVRGNVKCPPSENERENNSINLRLRSSSLDNSQDNKQIDSPNKTPVSANKGKKGSILSKMKESSLTCEASQERQGSPEIAKRLRSVNVKKKESKLPNKKGQCTTKTLKRRQTTKVQPKQNKSKATIMNTVSESESESENVVSKLPEVNGNGITVSMPMVLDNTENQKTVDLDSKNGMNQTNSSSVYGVKNEKHTCQKGKLGNTSLSYNSETAQHQVPISLTEGKEEPKNDSTLSKDLESSKSLLDKNGTCEHTVESPESFSPVTIAAVKIKKEPNDYPPETNEVNLNEIELDSFNPNAFTSNNAPNGLQNKVSEVQFADLFSSKNLLTDVKFSFLNSNISSGKTKKEDGKQKKTSNCGFSFLDSNAFSRELFKVPIKNEPLDPVIEESPKNDVVSNDKPQTVEILSDSNLNAELGLEDDFLEQKEPTEPHDNPNIERNSEKETSGISEPISSCSSQEQSSLNSEENGGNTDGRNDDSDEEGALVIADDAEPELQDSEPEKNESSEEASVMMSDATPQSSPAVAPQKKKSAVLRRRTSSTDSNKTNETGLVGAFKHLDKMKYSDSHYNYNSHFLYSAFINPQYTLEFVIYFVIKHLCTSKRNPLLSYSLSRGSPLLPLPEKCIVDALFKASSKPRLVKLLTSTKRSLYNIILAKQKLSIYGLSSLCRVFTEICRHNNDKREVISLCCDLLLKKHKFAAYMVASITGIWKDLFKPSDRSSEEEKIFFGAIAMVVLQKPRTLTQTQWNHCSNILLETMTGELPSDIKSTVEILEETIRKKCLKGKFANTVGLTTSLILIAQMQEWEWTKEFILDSFVIPCLKEFSNEEKDEKAFSLFCSLYGDISALSPDSKEQKNLLIHLFETKAGTHVQVSAAVTLLRLYLVKREAFPEFLGTWLTANHSHPKVTVLSDSFHQSLIADGDLLQTDISEC